MGMLDGGITPFEVVRAVAALKGAATNNLEVPLARDVTIGNRTYRKGEMVPTGLDVPKGGAFIVGIKSFYDRGHLRMGITCALCHAAVDPASGKVIEGAPNADLNAGLLMALSRKRLRLLHARERAGGGQARPGTRDQAALPDAESVESAMKVQVASWPPGSFDSSADRVTNPTSIPSSFSAYGEPYSWSGREMLGPFGGLSSLNNNVHAANSDTTQLAAASPWLFGLDPETYLGSSCAARRRGRSATTRPASAARPRLCAPPTRPPPRPGINDYAVLPDLSGHELHDRQRPVRVRAPASRRTTPTTPCRPSRTCCARPSPPAIPPPSPPAGRCSSGRAAAPAMRAPRSPTTR